MASAKLKFDGREIEIAEDAEKTSKMPLILGLMGIICGLAIV